MKNWILLLAFVLSVVAAVQAQKEGPTLKETLQWMQNTLASGAGDLYISTSEDGAVEKRELRLPEAETCEVSFTYQTGPLEKYSYGVIAKPTFKLVEKFNLKDIDPTTIEVGQPTKDGKPADIIGPFVIFVATTRNSAELISATSGVHPDSLLRFSTESLTFSFPYPYSERFTKAFKHGVALCGGRPSAF
jgi:hypothetical protein